MEIKDVFSLKIRDIFSLIISLPITIYVNFRCLPFKTALKLPIFVGYKTHIDKLSRNITFGCEPTTFMVQIGWGGTEGREIGKKNYLLLNENASIQFTIYVNFRCLPFKTALKLPIFVGYKTHIDKLSRNITFGCEPTTFMVRIGWGGTEGRELGKKNYLLLNENALIRFNGRCTMSSGVSLILDLGTLEIGNNFFCNKNCTISCNDRITIGDHVLFG